MQRKIFALIVPFLVLQYSLLCAGDTPVSLAVKNQSSPQGSSQEESSAPDWIKRTSIAVEAGTDAKTKYFLETIQPLSVSEDKGRALFTSARISGQDDRAIYNLGLGARRVFKDAYLLGTNIFYDYQDLHQHHRSGIGFEAMTDRGLEGRVNTYFKVSNIRQVEENAGGQNFEKVANGLDWEIGGPLPYLNALKLYGGGSWYSFERFRNKYGWKMRAEYNPVKYSRLVFEVRDDNKRKNAAYRVECAITLAFSSFHPRDILRDLKASKEAFPKINLKEKTLDRVVRDFDITVIETTKQRGGLVVEAGRT